VKTESVAEAQSRLDVFLKASAARPVVVTGNDWRLPASNLAGRQTPNVVGLP
jgi:hypothetical protein